jgi:HEAT repeat protein
MASVAEDDREPAERIAYFATTHPSPEIRRRACQHLRTHPSPRHASMLIPLLSDGDTAVVEAAVQALGASGSLADASPLKKLLASPNSKTQVAAAVALARLRFAQGPAALERLGYHRSAEIRLMVARSMGELADPAYTAALIRLLDDQPAVRNAALRALPAVTGTKMRTETGNQEQTVRRWQKWYHQQKGSLERFRHRDGQESEKPNAR